MTDRSKFQDRVDREVQQGRITKRQGRQALEAYDRRRSGKRRADDRDAAGDAIEGVLGLVWEVLFGGED